ncbi:alpha/beta hydrolase family protein [Membranihabitans maritimus]|uniref:alpha/beta hydrolase family protein n=1 Tax=Membranihabitans maritimus TaxID=2904244 RepID=UPI001F0127C5|nr:prolyl oligopeptidase family serine peptidase [Membranihabitans maritimus]
MNKVITLILGILVVLGVIILFFNIIIPGETETKNTTTQIRYDDQTVSNWQSPFEEVEIVSNLDDSLQKAWFLPSSSGEPMPLLVSLHTWSGNYSQFDTLAILAKESNWNYIHPDFRGPNKTFKACCSEWARNDIDEAIDYAIENGNVNPDKIFVVGVSGGGYAALSTYMTSRHKINKISAWVPISDLPAWYNQSKIRQNKYSEDIMNCTGSVGSLDIQIAKERSPIYWEVPARNTVLNIYAGVYDGIQGSVPITQSINFYNKIVSSLGAKDRDMVSNEEKLQLLENREPLAKFGKIGARDVCLTKEFKNISITIFMGNHEMLPSTAFKSLH